MNRHTPIFQWQEGQAEHLHCAKILGHPSVCLLHCVGASQFPFECWGTESAETHNKTQIMRGEKDIHTRYHSHVHRNLRNMNLKGGPDVTPKYPL